MSYDIRNNNKHILNWTEIPQGFSSYFKLVYFYTTDIYVWPWKGRVGKGNNWSQPIFIEYCGLRRPIVLQNGQNDSPFWYNTPNFCIFSWRTSKYCRMGWFVRFNCIFAQIAHAISYLMLAGISIFHFLFFYFFSRCCCCINLRRNNIENKNQ